MNNYQNFKEFLEHLTNHKLSFLAGYLADLFDRHGEPKSAHDILIWIGQDLEKLDEFFEEKPN